MDKRDLVSVFDYEAAAREKLPKTAFDYYSTCAKITRPMIGFG